jgi:putative SOS response-associated peptidase YedK
LEFQPLDRVVLCKTSHEGGRRNGQPVTIAGLWDQWHEKLLGEVIKSCAMVITGPNQFVAEVHDRMP